MSLCHLKHQRKNNHRDCSGLCNTEEQGKVRKQHKRKHVVAPPSTPKMALGISVFFVDIWPLFEKK